MYLIVVLPELLFDILFDLLLTRTSNLLVAFNMSTFSSALTAQSPYIFTTRVLPLYSFEIADKKTKGVTIWLHMLVLKDYVENI